MRTTLQTIFEGNVLEKLMERFKRSQPWELVFAPGVLEKAHAQVLLLYPEEQQRKAVLIRLQAVVDLLEKEPLKVLGYPPLGTQDPEAFRFTADPQSTVSVLADLDLGRRVLRVFAIKIKGGPHGRH